MDKQCRPRPEEQSDQGLHCLPFGLYLLDAIFYGKIFNFSSLSPGEVLNIPKHHAMILSSINWLQLSCLFKKFGFLLACLTLFDLLA